jgi:hypothetical protein
MWHVTLSRLRLALRYGLHLGYEDEVVKHLQIMSE